MVEQHYSRCWSPSVERLQWRKGPVDDLPEDFRVLVIPRSEKMMAYATCCMSQPEDQQRLELHLLARDREHEPSIAEVLTAIAHYHRKGRPLGLGHSINFGRPWLPGSTCTHGLVSLPYLDGPSLEYMAETKTRFLWLIPITAAEVDFKKHEGLDALEARFEEAQFDYLDPFRPSAV